MFHVENEFSFVVENGIDNIRFNATYLSVVENFLVYKMVVQNKLRLCFSY
ncbi:MAG: hypothetical protein K0T53_01660 [Wolbachia pipientis]|nr:hypothetical protein [Wolbachia pipientis]